MRDGWTADSNYLCFDCGPHGMLNGGHAHADALSFEVAANGSTVLVDPGTFTYTGSKEDRDWFRSSMAHNTLTIDGQSSSVAAGPFSWRRSARCHLSKWICHERFDLVTGAHDGYERLADPVKHWRSILFIKNGYWVIRDQLKSEAAHRVDLWFHFSPIAQPSIDLSKDGSPIVVSHEVNLQVIAEGGGWRREEAFVSDCYGSKAHAAVYAYTTGVNGKAEIFTLVVPRKLAVAAPRCVRELKTIGGKAFEIRHETGVDVVMTRSGEGGERVEMEWLSSDFAWTWARFEGHEEREPVELVAVDGSSLHLEGRAIVKWQGQVDYVVGKRLTAGYAWQTPEGHFERE